MIKLLRFMKPYRTLLIVVLVLAFAQSLANLYLPTLMADIVTNGILTKDIDYIWRIGGLMLLVTIGGTIAAVIGSFFGARVATGFGKIIRGELFNRVTQFSLQEFDQVSTASLITRTTNDTTQVQQVLIMALTFLITAPMTLIIGIILAVRLDATLSLIFVVVIPVLVAVIVFLLTRAIPLFRVMQAKLDKLNLILDEGLTGVRVVRAFDRVRHEEARFDEANYDLTNVAIRVNRMIASLMPVMMLVVNVSSIAILWFGGHRIASGAMPPGDLFAFLNYALQILFSLLMVSMIFIMLPRAAASADRINEVLAVLPRINDAEQAKLAEEQRGYVAFQDVTFSYPGAEEPALSNISFSAKPGQVTAIIGGTGSGKSTLVSLLPRFYDVDSGAILVDGVDVRDMTQGHLRSKIGFVPQKAVLFSGTIDREYPLWQRGRLGRRGAVRGAGGAGD